MSTTLTASFEKRYAGGPLIRVEKLCVQNGGIQVLFGASGSGKTTVLRCLAGLERPDEGTIRFGDETWLDSQKCLFLKPQQRRIGFVPQEYALFPHLTVEKNIGYGLHMLSNAERAQKVAEGIKWLGLDGLERRLPGELSGGQQQRVALARAVACQPRLLLLDEPLAALDGPTRQRLRGELRRLLTQLGIPTVVVTHDRVEALALGDTMVVMDGGKIIQQGPVHEVFSRPANLAVAGIVAVETVHPGHVLNTADGLVTVAVGNQKLTVLDRDLSPGMKEVFVCIRAEDVILMKGVEGHGSPRNQLSATVKAITHEGPMVRIDLDCGFPLTALLTRQGCEELALRENSQVLAMVKAPNVHLISRSE